jgi:hypothetical protein
MPPSASSSTPASGTTPGGDGPAEAWAPLLGPAAAPAARAEFGDSDRADTGGGCSVGGGSAPGGPCGCVSRATAVAAGVGAFVGPGVAGVEPTPLKSEPVGETGAVPEGVERPVPLPLSLECNATLPFGLWTYQFFPVSSCIGPEGLFMGTWLPSAPRALRASLKLSCGRPSC